MRIYIYIYSTHKFDSRAYRARHGGPALCSRKPGKPSDFARDKPRKRDIQNIHTYIYIYIYIYYTYTYIYIYIFPLQGGAWPRELLDYDIGDSMIRHLVRRAFLRVAVRH